MYLIYVALTHESGLGLSSSCAKNPLYLSYLLFVSCILVLVYEAELLYVCIVTATSIFVLKFFHVLQYILPRHILDISYIIKS